ncbi:MAG: DUF2905 family protein [Mesotoga sp.]|uniref:DUF2905 family protein n=1 Tax=unclassified Mesotoga TaxID=1184398 RepID=UPI0015FFCD92|nr:MULTISPECIES: DUF2905 family protein [unclassified Mesotoga]MDI9367927.1 DUF2905 family protein [Thermotogota bacterium]MDD2333931.1 DUF2905 family protein [Mesotoga sp.]MDD3680458.1 DUF2905 family protein [Mesotoga sp.]MDD4208604.1 DUF2905 family protein [Mesotoga sp.]MDD4826178.1 DUF2905 family protein [Mesotoga sp.]
MNYGDACSILLRRLGLHLGRLPRDIHINRSDLELWFPITSGLIVSVIIAGALGSGE